MTIFVFNLKSRSPLPDAMGGEWWFLYRYRKHHICDCHHYFTPMLARWADCSCKWVFKHGAYGFASRRFSPELEELDLIEVGWNSFFNFFYTKSYNSKLLNIKFAFFTFTSLVASLVQIHNLAVLKCILFTRIITVVARWPWSHVVGRSILLRSVRYKQFTVVAGHHVPRSVSRRLSELKPWTPYMTT